MSFLAIATRKGAGVPEPFCSFTKGPSYPLMLRLAGWLAGWPVYVWVKLRILDRHMRSAYTLAYGYVHPYHVLVYA